VQTMFSAHRPDVTLVTQVEDPDKAAPKSAGAVGVGTWNTQAEYKDLVVTQGDRELFRSDFTGGTAGWKLVSGDWKARDGALRQSSLGANLLATAGDPAWTDYAFSLKARKLGGEEGFLVLFRVRDDQHMAHWNIGGWGNKRSAVEVKEGGSNREVGKGPDGGIQNNRWYDIKVEVQGSQVSCYLDGKLMQSAILPAPRTRPGLFALGGKEEKTGQIILKAVNPGSAPIETTFRVTGAAGLKPKARVVTLAGDKPTDENTLDQPSKVVPVESVFEAVAPEFRYGLKPYSLTILRLETR
jgi:alpha-L-arabinofuranosidase